MPSLLSLLTHTYEDAKVHVRMLGIWSAAVGGAATLGPLLGGVLIHSFGWCSVFLINVPVGMFGLAMAHKMIPKMQKHARDLTILSHLLGITMLGAERCSDSGPGQRLDFPSDSDRRSAGNRCFGAAGAL